MAQGMGRRLVWEFRLSVLRVTLLPVHRAPVCTGLWIALPTETHHPSSLPQPLLTVPRLTWWGMGSLVRGLRPSSGVVAMAAAAAMAEEAARGSTGSSGLCSCFTMTEHSLCPSTHAPCSTSREGGRTQAQGTPRAEGSAPLLAPWSCSGQDCGEMLGYTRRQVEKGRGRRL